MPCKLQPHNQIFHKPGKFLFPSKSFFNLMVITVCLSLYFSLLGCVAYKENYPDIKFENIIGVPVLSESTLQIGDENSSQKIAIFDKTIKKIHLFDLNEMSHLGKYSVNNPDKKHYVFYKNDNQFIIDLSEKNINVIKLDSSKSNPVFKFQGNPKSTAYDSKSGFLIIYDEIQNVGIMKISKSGDIEKSIMTGNFLDSTYSIECGDIFEDGQLVLTVRICDKIT